MDPIILLIVGAVGLAGCVILLLLGLNMLRAERTHKDGVTAEAGPSGAAASIAPTNLAAPESAESQPELARPEPAKPAGASSGVTAVEAAFAGVAARFTGGRAPGKRH